MTALMDLTAQRHELATPTQARTARKAIRALAGRVLTDTDRADDVELMTGEAIANAWVHGTPPITVTVTLDAGVLQVKVGDRGPALAVTARGDNGRGLTIIEALATAWSLTQEPDGRTVLTFEVSTL